MSENEVQGNNNNQLEKQDSQVGPDDKKQIYGKDVVALNVTGTVSWFNVKSGYGMIHRDDVDEDIFVHQTAIIKNNPKKYLRSVDDGERVEFDIIQGEKSYEATNVTGPNGTNVQGSKYAADRRQFNTRGGFRGRPFRRPFRGGGFRGRGGSGRPPMQFRQAGFNRGLDQPMGSFDRNLSDPSMMRGGGCEKQDSRVRPDDKKQINGKDVVALNVIGTVSWFNVKSGYGFIHRNDVDEDIFGEKGYEATNITSRLPVQFRRAGFDQPIGPFDENLSGPPIMCGGFRTRRIFKGRVGLPRVIRGSFGLRGLSTDTM
ncbi:unnamed protein product [Didymodactylos carnosus]|uniref:CSD domain-containing protein n=1 Tax=Didymodactylos carnosus TaxID=1234261 RepID=A0A814A0Q0_9BILA|nr:unnamed protein product [Didymodactylos carnosus]CAF3689469.1 unnamed protein product [Didymodactylos carnosus]